MRKTEHGYVIELPDKLIAQLQLHEGDTVGIDIQAVPHPTKDKIKIAFEASWEANKDGYNYLAGR